MRLCDICLSLSILFYLAQCPQGPSMLSQMSISFLWLNNVPLYIYRDCNEHGGAYIFLKLVFFFPLIKYLDEKLVDHVAVFEEPSCYFQ